MSLKCCQFLFFVVGKKIHFVGISFKQCVCMISMSFFKYFKHVKYKAKGKDSDASLIAFSVSNKDKYGISREELITSEQLQDIDSNNKTAN